MDFRVFGPLTAASPDGPVALGGFNQRAVLGFLLIGGGRVRTIDQLVRALWPDGVPATGRKMVHNAVCGLRRAFAGHDRAGGAGVILTRPPGYLLDVEPECVDVVRFRRLAEQGRAESAAGAWEAAARTLRSALALSQEPPLLDLVAEGVAWPQVTALAQERADVLEDAMDAELAAGRHRQVAHEVTQAVRAAPTRERLCGQAMLALYRCGRQTEALGVYHLTRNRLAREHGVEPGRELQRLQMSILTHDPALDLTREPALDAVGPRGLAGAVGAFGGYESVPALAAHTPSTASCRRLAVSR
jgi:DNA-binding SARP family transcriptional activator